MDGFNATSDHRDYQDALRAGLTSRANLETTSNYDVGIGFGNQAFSIEPFSNINLSGANPALTISATPIFVNENSGNSIVYTFTLASTATTNITVNFNVSGTADFSTDFTQTGAATFSTTLGTVQINSGSNSASITISPVGDAVLEPDETLLLTIVSGTGYDIGNPNIVASTIANDDTQTVTPVVAVTGININSPEGFSFVALDDITPATSVYFTENAFNNNLLSFSGSEAVFNWISPGTTVTKEEVIVVKEDPSGTFTASSNSGNIGTISLISGTFS